MATPKEVYIALRSATEGTRDLDVQIAELLGWEQRETFITDISNGKKRPRHVWVPPGSDSPGKVPFFTMNLDAAYDLAASICPPGTRIGFSWEPNAASATIGDASQFHAATTPALALCVAAVVEIAAIASRQLTTA